MGGWGVGGSWGIGRVRRVEGWELGGWELGVGGLGLEEWGVRGIRRFEGELKMGGIDGRG